MIHPIPCVTPLDWPADQARTPAEARAVGRFQKSGGANYHARELTLREAQVRMWTEIDRYTPLGHDRRVEPDECRLSANLRVLRSADFAARQRQPDDPGAALRHTLDGEPRVLAIDGYTSVAQNIAAIAACVEALRLLERHGSNIASRIGSGLRALPAQVDGGWRAALGLQPGADLGEARAAWRRIAALVHPDTGKTPDAEAFQIAAEAWRQARAEFGA